MSPVVVGNLIVVRDFILVMVLLLAVVFLPTACTSSDSHNEYEKGKVTHVWTAETSSK